MKDTTQKVKLFTHTDLDGIGCEIVARLAYEFIDVERCDYHNVDEKVDTFLNDMAYVKYDQIFITDISVKEDVAKKLSNLCGGKVVLLDHHKTAEHLNQYPWARVQVEAPWGKLSGTDMLFDTLVDAGLFHYHSQPLKDALSVFVEKVRRYDSWEWKELYDDLDALALNDLFWLIGADSFTDSFIKKFKSNELASFRNGAWVQMFSEADKAVLKVDEEKKKAYFKRKEKQMVRTHLLGYDIGLVFAEQYISELGNVLSERNPDLEFIAIVDMGSNKVSFRTVNDSVHLGQDISSVFGGGGHAKASGMMFQQNIGLIAKSLIFKQTLLSKIVKFFKFN